MTHDNIYAMTERMINELRSRGHPLKCQSCGRILREGDRVVSKRAGGKSHQKIRHKHCAETKRVI